MTSYWSLLEVLERYVNQSSGLNFCDFILNNGCKIVQLTLRTAKERSGDRKETELCVRVVTFVLYYVTLSYIYGTLVIS